MNPVDANTNTINSSTSLTSHFSIFRKILSGIGIALIVLSSLMSVVPNQTFATSTIHGTTGGSPRGITIDSVGNVYTANYSDQDYAFMNIEYTRNYGNISYGNHSR